MKFTGIVKRIDGLGRVVLPVELRKTLGITFEDALEIFVDSKMIILLKIKEACILCDNDEDVITHKDKLVCKKCVGVLEEIKISDSLIFDLPEEQ